MHTVIVEEIQKTAQHRHFGRGRSESLPFRIHHEQDIRIGGYLEGRTRRILLVTVKLCGQANVGNIWRHGWVCDGRKSIAATVRAKPGTYTIEIEGQSADSGGEIVVHYTERLKSEQPCPTCVKVPVGPTDMEPGVYRQPHPTPTAPVTIMPIAPDPVPLPTMPVAPGTTTAPATMPTTATDRNRLLLLGGGAVLLLIVISMARK